MGDPSFSRMRRVNAIVHEVLAEQIEVLKDPRLEFVSVTGVDTTPNLRHAVVYFSTLDPAKTEGAQAGLDAAAPRLRRVLGDEVRMKYTPALEFRPDHGIAYGERIDAVLRQMQEPLNDE